MRTQVKRIRQFLIKENLDSLLVTNPSNIRYLTDLASPNPETREIILLVTPKKTFVFASPLLCITKSQPLANLPDVLKKYPRVGYEPDHLTMSEYTKLKTSTKLIPTDHLIENLRMIKKSSEIASITKACSLTTKAMKYAQTLLKPGRTEQAIAWEIEKYLRERGAESLAFPIIVASGPNSAIPHHTVSSRQIGKRDIVLIDMGIKINGYCSDMTRTFFIGQPTALQLQIASAVRQAHQAAMSALITNPYSLTTDSAARQVIESAGFGPYFIHGTGHSLGLDIHESPFLSQKATSYKLQAGMVLTIEPGIYIPGKFGYRYEDTVLLTKTNTKLLT